MRHFDSVVQAHAMQHKCKLVMQVHLLKKEKTELPAKVDLVQTKLSRMSDVYISPIYANEQKCNDISFSI